MRPLWTLAADLDAGRTSSAALTEEALARIDDPSGEGGRSFLRVFRDEAMAAAEASDRLRRLGIVASPLAGIPVSVKDLCDVAGFTTRAGSPAMDGEPPAEHDAPVVARLRAAGAVIVGTTNMVQFALGGTGINPHFGTPRNPWDRETGRIPGGSSSGAAVSVTDGMAAAALGTDTAGSVRMPAGLCGLTGFKPTARRVPREGILPLSTTLDSVGPLAWTVDCCALMDAVFAGETPAPVAAAEVAGLRIAVSKSVLADHTDKAVADAFAAALSRLSAAGAKIVEIPFDEMARLPDVYRRAQMSIVEGYAWHRKHLARARDKYDPIVASRFEMGADIGAADYLDALALRQRVTISANAALEPFDAVAMPTLPIVAPPIADLEADDDLLVRTGISLIRHCTVANFLDRCAVTLPCHAPGTAPVGLMLMGPTMGDRRLLAIAAGAEKALNRH